MGMLTTFMKLQVNFLNLLHDESAVELVLGTQTQVPF